MVDWRACPSWYGRPGVFAKGEREQAGRLEGNLAFELIWPIWCFGASLDQLSPVVELNKEFSDFFNDPHRQRLNYLQHLYFGMQALTGYLLGVALVRHFLVLRRQVDVVAPALAIF